MHQSWSDPAVGKAFSFQREGMTGRRYGVEADLHPKQEQKQHRGDNQGPKIWFMFGHLSGNKEIEAFKDTEQGF